MTAHLDSHAAACEVSDHQLVPSAFYSIDALCCIVPDFDVQPFVSTRTGAGGLLVLLVTACEGVGSDGCCVHVNASSN